MTERFPGFVSPFATTAPSELTRLRDKVAGYERLFEQLKEVGVLVFTVVAKTGANRGLIADTPPLEINLPAGAKVGSQLRTMTDTKQGLELLPRPVAFGKVYTVSEVHGERCLVHGEAQLMAIAEGLEIKPGDRVILDPGGFVALEKLEPAADAKTFSATAQAVSWDEIGGQQEAIEALREALEYPALHPEVYKAHGVKPAKGVMLYGPAGTGKTLLGKALATGIAGDTSGFIYMKASEVMVKWQGESGQTVRSLFQRCRDYQAKTGKRALLFLDEADALLQVRDGTGVKASGGIEDMVPVFLAEMDGLDELGPFVLLATNRPDRIDPAVIREGRIDQKIRVGRPDQSSCAHIFGLHLHGKRCDAGVLAALAANELWSDRYKLYELTWKTTTAAEYVWLRDCVSGAMIEGIVSKAVRAATKRDLEAPQLSDLSFDDIKGAIETTFQQLAHTNHREVILEKAEAYGRPPDNVRRLVR